MHISETYCNSINSLIKSLKVQFVKAAVKLPAERFTSGQQQSSTADTSTSSVEYRQGQVLKYD